MWHKRNINKKKEKLMKIKAAVMREKGGRFTIEDGEHGKTIKAVLKF